MWISGVTKFDVSLDGFNPVHHTVKITASIGDGRIDYPVTVRLFVRVDFCRPCSIGVSWTVLIRGEINHEPPEVDFDPRIIAPNIGFMTPNSGS
jgi:hypothetical protein